MSLLPKWYFPNTDATCWQSVSHLLPCFKPYYLPADNVPFWLTARINPCVKGDGKMKCSHWRAWVSHFIFKKRYQGLLWVLGCMLKANYCVEKWVIFPVFHKKFFTELIPVSFSVVFGTRRLDVNWAMPLCSWNCPLAILAIILSLLPCTDSGHFLPVHPTPSLVFGFCTLFASTLHRALFWYQ